jgi:hypothetical protein
VRVLVVASLLAGAPMVAAESVYVIEQLVVSVNSAPEGAGERIGSIRSGDRVEVLERLGGETRVRLVSGTEGWVKSAYLSSEPPLRTQLAERTRELESMRAQLDDAERQLASSRSGAAPLPARPVATATGPDVLPGTQRRLFPARGAPQDEPSWGLVAGASVAALAAGFALGWGVLDRRIRRKYGGLRIY